MVTTSGGMRQFTHDVECMEVWGGNRARDNAVSVPGIDAWINSQPLQDEAGGGDIHYVSTCGAGRVSRFAVADVSGHGPAVDELATRLRRLMRKHINTLDQTRFAQTLNRELIRLERAGRFATALLATYVAASDHLIVCNAGHPRPLFYRAAARHWELLDTSTAPPTGGRVLDPRVNLPLGVVEPARYVQFAVRLGKGDLILIYTDSLIESRRPGGRTLGEQGLLQLAAELPVGAPDEIIPRLVRAAADRRDHAPAADDQTLMLLHHNAADPPAPSLGQTLRALARRLGSIAC
jgi:serine phosphatase RsbU (regulator of sigma subunit)